MFPVICLTVCQSAAVLAFLAGRIAPGGFHAVMAFLAGLGAVLAVWCHWTVTADVCAGCTAVHAWRWWSRGGGDGIRRRLKCWARRFEGTRRASPSHA
ncbi:hypothetical protein ACH4LN_32010 [Streptomyces albus]|uniref:hypothetical protein n=1 Tax=Streptomyces TaxID=1883 RepID=UPI0004C1E38F|nr:hypothetical protein [Streptomyces sp. NRRL F-5917]